MKNTKLNLALGIVIGATLTFLYLNYYAPRYEIEKVGLSLVKTDKWTGQSWKYINDNWKKVVRFIKRLVNLISVITSV